MLSEPYLLALLDWIARGAVVLVAFMLRWLLLLDKKFTLLERNHLHAEKLAEIEHGRRSAERREIMAILDKHDAALQAHNANVTNALADIRHLLDRTAPGK